MKNNNKKKLFVVGDIHGYFNEFKEALDNTDYDKENPDHLLISLGDNFDRGRQPQDILDFLQTQKNAILIKGNHEDLILDCLERGYPTYKDNHNGTTQTIKDLGNYENMTGNPAQKFLGCCFVTYEKINNFIYNMYNYYETKKYIFVHSWIPLKEKVENDVYTKVYYNEWRNAHQFEWDDARWGNPFEFAKLELNKTGKIIVFGHWHTSWWKEQENGIDAFGPEAAFSPVYLKKYNCIGIDGCTAYTHKVNILCLEDELLEDING